MKVLIAEDSANSRQALAEFFRSHGIFIVEAADGVQARACLQSEVFDAVVLHLNLPRTTPGEIAEALWAANPAAVMVIVTAFGDGFRQVSRAPQSNVYLVQKPYRAAQVLHLIRDAGANKAL